MFGLVDIASLLSFNVVDNKLINFFNIQGVHKVIRQFK